MFTIHSFRFKGFRLELYKANICLLFSTLVEFIIISYITGVKKVSRWKNFTGLIILCLFIAPRFDCYFFCFLLTCVCIFLSFNKPLQKKHVLLVEKRSSFDMRWHVCISSETLHSLMKIAR